MGFFALQRHNYRIVNALRTFEADNDDIAFVELEPNGATHIALCFRDERLKRFPLWRKPEAVVNQLAVLRDEDVAQLDSHGAVTIAAAGESSPTCTGRSRQQVQL
jgi:hypothetical protein